MSSSALLRPDVLVLAGGGIVGEAWMHGVLAGLEDAGGADYRRVEAYVGTSAGSIVAARLVAGRRPPRPGGSAREAAPGFAEEVADDGPDGPEADDLDVAAPTGRDGAGLRSVAR